MAVTITVTVNDASGQQLSQSVTDAPAPTEGGTGELGASTQSGPAPDSAESGGTSGSAAVDGGAPAPLDSEGASDD